MTSIFRLSRPLICVPAMLVALAAVPTVPALAHHSFAMFDQQKDVTITGTVKEFQFNNPHCFIQLMVLGKNGVGEEWSIEMGPPAHLVSVGWSRMTIRPGDKITLHVHPLKEGKLGGAFISATTSDGKKL